MLINVINRPRDTDRLAKAMDRAATAGFTAMVYPAVETPQKGEIGCLLSHRQCVRNAQKMGQPHAWIMEDDAIFRDMDLWPALMSQLADVEWDIFYPYNWANKLDVRPAEIKLEQMPGTLCTHFWAIHSRFYDGFLKILDDWTGPIDRAFIGRTGIRQYAPNYNLVGQDANVSLTDGNPKPLRWHE